MRSELCRHGNIYNVNGLEMESLSPDLGLSYVGMEDLWSHRTEQSIEFLLMPIMLITKLELSSDYFHLAKYMPLTLENSEIK